MCIYSVGWSHIRIAEQKGLKLGVTKKQLPAKKEKGVIRKYKHRNTKAWKPMAKY